MFASIAAAAWMTLALAGSDGVYRCVGAHGEQVFSGQPCNSPGNQVRTAPPSVDVIRYDNCAISANELRDRVTTAFDNRDVNTLGGLFLWRGFATRSAYARMRELKDMLRQPLLDVTLAGPADWIAESAGYGQLPAYGDSWLSIQVADADAQDATIDYRFALVEQDGCVWLGF